MSRTINTLLSRVGLARARSRPPLVAKPKYVDHENWASHLSREFNSPGMAVLEIGSRVVTGGSLRPFFAEADYVGFDFYEGENVDIVGDAHRLSDYFDPDRKFDLIISSAVFEHLHMPWVVSEQISRLLKLGGVVFVETHFSFVSHERPWNFFQFSDMGLRALFNEALGFEVLDSGMSNPMTGQYTRYAAPYLRYRSVKELYCHSEILARKVREVTDFSWANTDLKGVVGETRYPRKDTGA